jgi:hypothetical protein
VSECDHEASIRRRPRPIKRRLHLEYIYIYIYIKNNPETKKAVCRPTNLGSDEVLCGCSM